MEDFYLYVVNEEDDNEGSPWTIFLPENMWDEKFEELTEIVRAGISIHDAGKLEDFLKSQIAVMSFALIGGDDDARIYVPKSEVNSIEEAEDLVTPLLPKFLKVMTVPEYSDDEYDDRDENAYIVELIYDQDEYKISAFGPNSTSSMGGKISFLKEIGPYKVSKTQFVFCYKLRNQQPLIQQVLKIYDAKKREISERKKSSRKA